MNKFHYRVIDSTNDELKRLIEKGDVDPLHGAAAVTADEQTEGHGRHGRKWESTEGGVYVSVLLENLFDNPVFLNFHSGVIAYNAIRVVMGDFDGKLMLKWPNDIYVGEKKLGGVLVDSVFNGDKCKRCIVGFGINVFNMLIPSSGFSPDLDTQTLVELREGIIREADNGYFVERMRENPGAIVPLFESAASLSREIDLVYTTGEDEHEGRLLGIDKETGAAEILTKDGNKLILEF